MATIRSLLGRSRYTVDVYRATVEQAYVAGLTPQQWIETHSATPVLAGVVVLLGSKPIDIDVLVTGNVASRTLGMAWLADDIQMLDTVLVHGPAGSQYDGKYYLVKRVNRYDMTQAEVQTTALLEELLAGYPTS